MARGDAIDCPKRTMTKDLSHSVCNSTGCSEVNEEDAMHLNEELAKEKQNLKRQMQRRQEFQVEVKEIRRKLEKIQEERRMVRRQYFFMPSLVAVLLYCRLNMKRCQLSATWSIFKIK